MRECSLGFSKMLSNILCQNALLIKCSFHEEHFFRRAFCQRILESIFERAKEHSCKIDFCRFGLLAALCFQTSTNSHGWSCLKMSHTQDIVMITPAISFQIFEGEIWVFEPQNDFKVLSSTCVKVTADTNRSQE